MTRSQQDPPIRIEDDGRVLATAEIGAVDAHGVVHSDMHVESGHLPQGTRTRLVDAVLDSPQLGGAETLVATMPISDSEMLERVRERTDEVGTRAAGATKIVEARLDPRADREG